MCNYEEHNLGKLWTVENALNLSAEWFVLDLASGWEAILDAKGMVVGWVEIFLDKVGMSFITVGLED